MYIIMLKQDFFNTINCAVDANSKQVLRNVTVYFILSLIRDSL